MARFHESFLLFSWWVMYIIGCIERRSYFNQEAALNRKIKEAKAIIPVKQYIKIV